MVSAVAIGEATPRQPHASAWGYFAISNFRASPRAIVVAAAMPAPSPMRQLGAISSVRASPMRQLGAISSVRASPTLTHGAKLQPLHLRASLGLLFLKQLF